MSEVLQGVRLTVSQPKPDNFQSEAGTATLSELYSTVNNQRVLQLGTGELYYAEDRDDSGAIIPRLFTKNSEEALVCLTPHVFSGASAPEAGYRDGDIWIKTAAN